MHYETKSILDKIKGSIILATEEGEQEYANVDAIPENLLDAEMIVSAIEARDSKIVLYLKKNRNISFPLAKINRANKNAIPAI